MDGCRFFLVPKLLSLPERALSLSFLCLFPSCSCVDFYFAGLMDQATRSQMQGLSSSPRVFSFPGRSDFPQYNRSTIGIEPERAGHGPPRRVLSCSFSAKRSSPLSPPQEYYVPSPAHMISGLRSSPPLLSPPVDLCPVRLYQV